MNKDKKIEIFETNIANGCSELERLVYSEAIVLLNSDVNPDKVNHWVNVAINTFNDKPKPLSDKEKQKRKNKQIRKQQKNERIVSLNTQMKELLVEYGVFVIGFFDYKDISDYEYNLLSKVVKANGYWFTDIGDGALEPFITKKSIDNDFLIKYNDIRYALEDLSSKDNVLDNYFTMDVGHFSEKITKLI